jgi:hypothetical protein
MENKLRKHHSNTKSIHSSNGLLTSDHKGPSSIGGLQSDLDMLSNSDSISDGSLSRTRKNSQPISDVLGYDINVKTLDQSSQSDDKSDSSL